MGCFCLLGYLVYFLKNNIARTDVPDNCYVVYVKTSKAVNGILVYAPHHIYAWITSWT